MKNIYNLTKNENQNKCDNSKIYNKIDALEGVEPRVDIDKDGRLTRVWCSAKTGAGIEELKAVLLAHMQSGGFLHQDATFHSKDSGPYEPESVEQVG